MALEVLSRGSRLGFERLTGSIKVGSRLPYAHKDLVFPYKLNVFQSTFRVDVGFQSTH